jgi:hypothetical protein
MCPIRLRAIRNLRAPALDTFNPELTGRLT